MMAKDGVSEQEIYRALEQAQIVDFVKSSQEKLEMFVGVGGSQLSGGQKQRIAIARAILKDPSIFLFDEATSALDRRNQKLIHDTLTRISSEKMSITVAHRPLTLINCEEIVTVEAGKILQKKKGREIPFCADRGENSNNKEGKQIKQDTNG